MANKSKTWIKKFKANIASKLRIQYSKAFIFSFFKYFNVKPIHIILTFIKNNFNIIDEKLETRKKFQVIKLIQGNLKTINQVKIKICKLNDPTGINNNG